VTRKLIAADITGTAGTVKIPQLGEGAGTVYVAVAKGNKAESSRKAVSFSAEPVTAVPSSLSVSITNAYGASDDTVTVTGVTAGLKVNLYTSSTAEAITQDESGNTVSFTLASGKLNAGGGTLYLSFKASGAFHESVKKAYSYKAEAKAHKLPAGNITVNNKSGGTSDEVVITVQTQTCWAASKSIIPKRRKSVSGQYRQYQHRLRSSLMRPDFPRPVTSSM
jgi:hypothetical protein